MFKTPGHLVGPLRSSDGGGTGLRKVSDERQGRLGCEGLMCHSGNEGQTGDALGMSAAPNALDFRGQ